MRIERICIASFGGVRDRDYRLSGGADVLYGPNESGKTSTMEFIRSVLSPSRKKRYPEKARTDSGTLNIEDGGSERALELSTKPSDGIPEAVSRLDPEVFRKIFVMDAESLDDSRSVSEGEIRTRFLTIPGGDGVPRAISWADDSVRDVVGLRSSSPSELLRIEEEISACEAKVAEMRQSADAYGGLASEKAELQRELDGIRASSVDAEKAKAVVQNYRNNRGNYDRLQQLGEERRALGDFVPVTSDDVRREAELRIAADSASRRRSEAQEALDRAKADAGGADLRKVSRRAREIDELPGRYRAYQQDRVRLDEPQPAATAVRRKIPALTLAGVALILVGIAATVATDLGLVAVAAGAVLAIVGLRRAPAPEAPVRRDVPDARASAESFESDLRSICDDIGVRYTTPASSVDSLTGLRQTARAVQSADDALMKARLADADAKGALTAFYTRYSGRDGFEAARRKTASAGSIDKEAASIRDAISRSGLDPDRPVCPVEWTDDGSSARAEDLSRRIGEIGERMRGILDMTELESEMDRLASLRSERAAILRRGAVALIARSLMADSCSDAFGSVQPAVVSTAGRYLGMMAGGQVSLEIDPADGGLKVVGPDGARGEGRWSSGLRAQVLLSVKLAVAKEMGRGEIPVVLDDVLLPFDSSRKRGALRALKEVSEEMQVILFTCDAETRDLAGAEGLPVQSMRSQVQQRRSFEEELRSGPLDVVGDRPGCGLPARDLRQAAAGVRKVQPFDAAQDVRQGLHRRQAVGQDEHRERPADVIGHGCGPGVEYVRPQQGGLPVPGEDRNANARPLLWRKAAPYRSRAAVRLIETFESFFGGRATLRFLRYHVVRSIGHLRHPFCILSVSLVYNSSSGSPVSYGDIMRHAAVLLLRMVY